MFKNLWYNTGMKFRFSDFFSDVTNFVKGGRVLGVDIGTSSIKLVELSRRADRFRLLNYGILETKDYLEHPNLALQGDSLKLDEKKTSELLRLLVRQTGVKSTTALVSIPSYSSFVTVLDMPLLSLGETEKAVLFQARQFIPLEPSEVTLDWSKVDETVNERGQRFQKILLIGIPNEIVEVYKRTLKVAGLRTVALELESIALARALLHADPRPTMIVDIGGIATNVVVVEGGVMKYSGQTNHAGLYLTRALEESLGVSMSRAEELKKRSGLLGKGSELELSTLLLSFLDVIIEEAQRLKSIFEERYSKKVQKLILTGGGANLQGVEKYMGEQIGFPISPSQVFLDIEYDPRLGAIERGLGNELAVAVGVARRYFM